MRWPTVRNIWFREVRDQLRDRRTVFMLVALPLLLYPLIGMSVGQFTVFFVEQPIRVGVAGAELLEETGTANGASKFTLSRLPPLLEGEHFAGHLFKEPGHAEQRMRVLRGDEDKLERLLQRGEIQAYVVFTRQRVNDLKAGKQLELDIRLKRAEEVDESPAPGPAEGDVSLYSEDDLSRLAYARLRFVFRQWDRAILEARLKQVDAPPHFHEPLHIPPLRAKTERLWGRIFPFLLVMMSLTGALYPAIDVCAGEKERGTMETLLVSPATRGEIVCGKFLTVWLFSGVTALLNLASLGVTAWVLFAGGAASPVPAPGWVSLLWGVVLLVPLAAFFSATCLALAIYARSSKEGQYYLMPLMVITLILTVVSLLPGAELSPVYSMLPITGAALLLQALMNAATPAQLPWLYLGPVLVPLAAYCYLALHWAVQQFKREEVLFREAERLDLRLWVKRIFREKEPLPTVAQAMTCFFAILFLGWVLSARTIGADFLTVTAVRQLAFIAAPALFMSLLLTSRPRRTLRLWWPAPAWLGLAVLLACAFHGPMVWAVKAILDRFPHIKEQVEELSRLVNLDSPLWAQLLVLAALPAVCEELAFRGFILSGLTRRVGPDKAILVSSLLFAFAHMNAFRFLPTFVLGCVLGLLATRSGSLLPGMVFHLLHNGLVVLVAYLALQAKQGYELPEWTREENVYGWPALTVSTLAAVALAIWLYYLPPKPFKDAKPVVAGDSA